MRKSKAEALRTRDTVLDAAARVMVAQGVGAFTLDAVAQAAGLTKGGVLHHFPSKEALLDGLVDQVVEAYNTRLTTELAAEPEGVPGRWLRAYIRTVFGMEYADRSLIPALAAAVAADHRVLERIRGSIAQSQHAAAEDGLEPLRATLLRLAVDGIVFARALNLDVLDTDTSRRVSEELFRLTETSQSWD